MHANHRLGKVLVNGYESRDFMPSSISVFLICRVLVVPAFSQLKLFFLFIHHYHCFLFNPPLLFFTFILSALVVLVIGCMSISWYIESNIKPKLNPLYLYIYMTNKAESDIIHIFNHLLVSNIWDTCIILLLQAWMRHVSGYGCLIFFYGCA